MKIESLIRSDWSDVRRIYEEGIASGDATFEVAAPSWPEWDESHRPDCRLAARADGSLLGWAALSPVSGRCVYGGVAEVSVYVARSARGRGIGGRLLAKLVDASERAGLWTLQAGIFEENEASLRVHRSAGFRVVGRRERIGALDGRWRDVTLLERRSRVVGVD